MNGTRESELTSTAEPAIELSYIRFDRNSTFSTSSSIVLSSCSNDEENKNQQAPPPLRWKRQKVLNNRHHNTLSEQPPGGNDTVNNGHIDGNLAVSAKEDVAAILDEELRSIPPRRLPPIPEDKLHRRNPHTVRQEIRAFDDLIPETNLADVHLSEMPGLQNTEQWKRIAVRAVHESPPLSRQYYQTVVSTIDLPTGQVPQPLGSYRRPGRSDEGQDRPRTSVCRWRIPHRRIFFGSSIAVIVIAVVVSVVLAVMLAQKPSQATTDYYAGSVSVRAKFEQALLNSSSSLVKSYKRQFCTLIGTTLTDTKTRYALYYSTCSVIAFHNGSIVADFVLGFTHPQNEIRLSSFLNHTLFNQSLFGGKIFSVTLNSDLDQNNNSQSTFDDYGNGGDNSDPSNSGKGIMTEPTPPNDQAEPTRTTNTIVTYTKLDTGLSITISETVTITNNNNATNTAERSAISNRNYELILIPTIDETKTFVIPTDETNERSLLPPPATTTNNVLTKSPSDHHLLPAIQSAQDSNFAYIDESSDDRTYSSGDVNSTLEDLTARDSTTSPSTLSLNDETLLKSNSTLVDNSILPTKGSATRPGTSNRPLPSPPPTKEKDEESGGKPSNPSRPNLNAIKRQRRMVIARNQRRLLQYELMPTGKVYYIDRPFSQETKTAKDDPEDNSSAAVSTILSRSSSLDTLSDKHYRRRRHHHHHHHQQQDRSLHPDFALKNPEDKLSVGGRLASSNNLPSASSPFQPISADKKKRFSSFDPTPESLDRVFDVLIAADKRREEHEFWREKFDHPRQASSRLPPSTGRTHGPTPSNTIPFIRSKQTHLTPSATLSPADQRSQSYTAKRNSFFETNHQRRGGLLEDCLRRRALAVQQTQRNYSPNIIYSTNYPKQEPALISKPPLPVPTTTNQQPVRILPVSNGRIGRAPQARQTSDELSSVSDIWATRSSLEDESHHHRPLRRPINHARFQSNVTRHRANEQKALPNKRASSAEQQKSGRLATKTSATTKSKFFDLFKFNR